MRQKLNRSCILCTAIPGGTILIKTDPIIMWTTSCNDMWWWKLSVKGFELLRFKMRKTWQRGRRRQRKRRDHAEIWRLAGEVTVLKSCSRAMIVSPPPAALPSTSRGPALASVTKFVSLSSKPSARSLGEASADSSLILGGDTGGGAAMNLNKHF